MEIFTASSDRVMQIWPSTGQMQALSEGLWRPKSKLRGRFIYQRSRVSWIVRTKLMVLLLEFKGSTMKSSSKQMSPKLLVVKRKYLLFEIKRQDLIWFLAAWFTPDLNPDCFRKISGHGYRQMQELQGLQLTPNRLDGQGRPTRFWSSFKWIKFSRLLKILRCQRNVRGNEKAW